MNYSSDETADCVVIGGGLAGLLGALRLSEAGTSVVIVDQALPQAEGRLGGFAEFSGAKFSFLPAGRGLIALAGSVQALLAATESVLDRLKLPSQKTELLPDTALNSSTNLDLRIYHSIVVEPATMESLINQLAEHAAVQCRIIYGRVERLVPHDSGWLLEGSGLRLLTRQVLHAGGRSGIDLLKGAGAAPQVGKGIDVGVRLEFPDRAALNGLRSFGPDAKIIADGCRTFCLNSPGRIYRYLSDTISIPGGVVAGKDEPSANVGILVRLGDKDAILERTKTLALELGADLYEQAPIVFGPGLADKTSFTRQAWGDDVVGNLEAFCRLLADNKLIDFSAMHMVHWPLLDWHWPVFGLTGSAATTKAGIYVAGDSAGHARGLLQAAVSGWLAAEEIIRDA